jgi:hypothetical protein
MNREIRLSQVGLLLAKHVMPKRQVRKIRFTERARTSQMKTVLWQARRPLDCCDNLSHVLKAAPLRRHSFGPGAAVVRP